VTEVGAFEAKTHFSQILARAAEGEEFTITLRGHPVARLVPHAPAVEGAEVARAAFDRLRARAAALGGAKFDWCEWRSYRDEGRR